MDRRCISSIASETLAPGAMVETVEPFEARIPEIRMALTSRSWGLPNNSPGRGRSVGRHAPWIGRIEPGPVVRTGTLGFVNRSDLRADIAAYIDHHHPRFGSALMKMRWGGLRTIQPARTTWAAMGLFGGSLGIASRAALGRRPDGRHRIPLSASLVLGPTGVWAAVWRFDNARWRRTHLTLVLDLPGDVLDDLIAVLAADGVVVERRYGPRSVDGRSTGISCRLRDLRRVNTALDALTGDSGHRGGSGEV
jgi:hypothetical protein